MKNFTVLLIIFLLALSGCTSHQSMVDAEKQATTPLPLPSTFKGRLPCSDCDGVDITLNFREDGLYQLRKTEVRGEKWDSTSEMGRWKFDQMDNLIVLGEKRGSLKTLILLDNDTLRVQDVEGRKISTAVNYDLRRATELDPFPDSVRIRGMYSANAESGFFAECQNAIRFPVAIEKDGAKCLQIYNTTPHGQGEPLLVSIEGSLVKRAKLEGTGEEEVLVVDQFLEILPGQSCDGTLQQNDLFNITWRLIELDGKPITLEEGQREPFVILDIEDNKMRGFSGCNRFFGTYLVKGEIFVFNKMAATRMACLKGIALEDAFLKAIRSTEAYRIRNDILELRDRNERILAKLRGAR